MGPASNCSRTASKSFFPYADEAASFRPFGVTSSDSSTFLIRHILELKAKKKKLEENMKDKKIVKIKRKKSVTICLFCSIVSKEFYYFVRVS